MTTVRTNRLLALTSHWSSTNLGDGMLLRQSLDAIERNGWDSDVVVLSKRPETVSGAGAAPLVGAPRAPSVPGSLYATARNFVHRPGLAAVREWPRQNLTAVVAIGGGYLDLASSRAAVMFARDHLPGLDLAGYSGIASAVLPISVGPLHWSIAGRVRRALRRFDVVFVRDDETADLLADLDQAIRVPDLAVQALAETDPGAPRATGSRIGLVARPLPAADDRYATRIRALAAAPDVQMVLQTDTDAAFYAALRVPPPSSLADYPRLRAGCGVVVSVRLHGAIMAAAAGIPAIHLSYDRKGPGAFGDLDLTPWLHDARSFDPEEVLRQARDLAADPAEYWSRLARSRERVRSGRQRMDAVLRALLAG